MFSPITRYASRVIRLVLGFAPGIAPVRPRGGIAERILYSADAYGDV